MREEVRLFPFYEKLTAAEREKLAGSARVHTFERGAQVHGGDCTGLILVLEGRLRAYILSEEGREITLFRIEKGGVCLLSASCVLRGLSVDVFIRADTAARVLLVPSEVFRELSGSSLAVSAFTSEMMAERLSRALWVLDEVLNKKFDARLASLLAEEAGYAGSNTSSRRGLFPSPAAGCISRIWRRCALWRGSRAKAAGAYRSPAYFSPRRPLLSRRQSAPCGSCGAKKF